MVVYTGELCLTLPVLPWHSMVAARCQEPLDVISFGDVFDSSLSRGSVAAFPMTWPKRVRIRSA